jgi:hypothetical protein
MSKLPSFENCPQCLVVGDVMLDRYWFGDVRTHFTRGAGAGAQGWARRRTSRRCCKRGAEYRGTQRTTARCCLWLERMTKRATCLEKIAEQSTTGSECFVAPR